tara:strand:+ start:3830 stop:4720 length:891 start_codon:yes stop_codon:yes gene_type:complete
MEEEKKVKNLIISGGCVGGFIFYGCLKKLQMNGDWDIHNIENIYASSVGTIVGLMIALKYTWDELDDFLIQRPWYKILKIDISEIFNVLNNKGFYNKKLFHDAFDNLLHGKDLSPNITMKEFYEYSNIKFHIIVTNLNKMKLMDINHETYPDFPLIDAIFCSSALPLVFSPYYFENNYLCDGGFISNYPIDYCLTECKAEETIGVGLDQNLLDLKENDEKEGLNMFSYLLMLFLNILKSYNKKVTKEKLKREIYIDTKFMDMEYTYNALFEKETRKELIQIGIDNIEEPPLLIVNP